MTTSAKPVKTGRSRAARTQKGFRFEGSKVFIRRDPSTGGVTLFPKPEDWRDFILVADKVQIPDDFLVDLDLGQAQERGLF